MLENIIKNLKRKIMPLVLISASLLNSGCVSYETMSEESIRMIIPRAVPVDESIDYSLLTWQEVIEYI